MKVTNPARHGSELAHRPRGSKGKSGCTWCGGEVKKPRRTFCSAACVHEYRLRSDAAYMRRAVHERDKGVCACCGLDTEAWKRAYRSVSDPNVTYDEARRRWRDLCALMRKAGRIGASGHAWEADHIVPVVEGGGQCGLENMRTLCIRCHKHVTAELRARLAGKKLTPTPEPTRQIALWGEP